MAAARLAANALTPMIQSGATAATPAGAGGGVAAWGETPAAPGTGAGAGGGAMVGKFGMTPKLYMQAKWERDIAERNRPMTDDELDAIFPPRGFKVLPQPAGYVPIRTPARKLMTTPAPLLADGQTPGFSMLEQGMTPGES